jgi:PAS domain S-box-containing protein
MNPNVDLNQLIQAVGDAVVVCDVQGAITLWNPGAERMFGYSPQEAMGRNLDLITPERLRQRHWTGYHHSMETGTTRYGHDVLRVPAINKAGDAMSIAFTVAMLHGPDGKVNGCAAVIRDETQRFQEDRALKKRIAELESELATHSAEPKPSAGA